jgi:hypothetical protein
MWPSANWELRGRLAPGATLSRRYRIVVAAAWERAQIAGCLAGHPG